MGTTNYTITKGQSQFNSDSFKKSKTTLGKFYQATHAIAEFTSKERARVSGFAKVIASDKADLMALGKGETDGILRSADEIAKELADFQAKVVTCNENIKAYSEKQDKAINNAMSLITDELYTSYKDNSDYSVAIAEWLFTLGLVQIGQADIDKLALAVGNKKNGTNAIIKTGNFVAKHSRKDFNELLIKTLADMLKDAGTYAQYVYKLS